MGDTGEASIYDAIGGEDALIKVVDDFYRRVMDDSELAGFFAGTNMTKLKGRQVEFFAMALGGPQSYSGASIRDVHQGRGIGQEHFNLVAGHLTGSLSDAGVPDGLVAEIIGIVAPLSSDIVSNSAQPLRP